MPDDPLIIVVDANVVVRAFASRVGEQAEVLLRVRGVIQLAVTDAIVVEYAEVGRRRKVERLFSRKGVAVADFDTFVARLLTHAMLVEPQGEPPPCRDQKDRPYLHCAIAAAAAFLITNDKDLLVEERIENTRIVEPREFLAWFRQQS